ncbi:MAG: DNA-3-methyladenine glycosylase 2 family protein [Nitrospira sp.]|nr:DNA-3-methyladenine glycosylase 2 family protein [Nitrospira sp.]MBP6604823.1 DNA-3-methyladenine glycosylase 2 family protein [Nitrospira sp.]HQY57089.1 DNA-3-methyladenine glycosylase 2 family protein [Nitrospira sp.]HRA97196.1 DNA-3-methyladenine glycosylase 2 family protein [Nitrospira sp.]
MSRQSPEMTHLCRIDPVMKRVIGEVGPYALLPRVKRSPFESLARAIAYQQLHDKAAESILKRFIALFPGRRFPRPADLLAVAPEIIRSTGFSRAKIAALHDLAAKAMDGTVPTTAVIQRLDDDAIVERLIAVRGIGRWTVEMLLIFQLGRPDVLPVDDFGVRNGFRIAYKRRAMPTPKELMRYGERWRPYRTAAAWYLWRAADRAKVVRPSLPAVTAARKRA